MILIDTNIISELMKPEPSSVVLSWLDQQEVTQLYVSTISIAEIVYGISVLPEGNRRNVLEEFFRNVLREAFEHRILPFHEMAAYTYGKIMSLRKSLGKPLSVLDGQIAAIARVNNFMVATRNSKDFSDCGLNLINPFGSS